MNDALLEAFRHHGWATKELIAFCRGLTEQQLASAATGSYGDIVATFNHLLLADAGYVSRLTGGMLDWATARDETGELDQLEARVNDTQRLWERFLSAPLDAERVMILDKGTYETHASVIVAQALHHGSAHREQICAILTGIGMQPPDVQAWAYADATGRARPVTTGG